MSAPTRGGPLLLPWRLLSSAFLLLLIAGCAGRPLMPTPELYAAGIREPFSSSLAPELASHQVDLLYATDRVLAQGQDGRPEYGYQRSLSLAFGSAVVEIGEGLTWEQLEAESRSRRRSGSLQLKLRKFRELGRFPDSPYPLALNPAGGLVVDPEVVRERDRAIATLGAELRRRLALTPRKELFLFVHGFNNTFEDAAFTQAELWHFLGREGVPMIYTWPAGRGGIRGYAYDRESGEFTIFHLKELMRALVSIPEVEGIHILAHSRGTDITVSALRELIIEAAAAGLDPMRQYRIRNLILAAPDIDMEVMSQRVIAERLGKGIANVTVYTSIGDKAISASEMLFSSRRRLGRAVWSGVPEAQLELVSQELQKVERIDFVEHRGKAQFIGHGYFHNNPSASSDLILILRDQLEPGSEGRPLKAQSRHFWLLEDGYLTQKR